MKNITRETAGSARCEKVACRELFSVLRYREKMPRASRAAVTRSALVTTRKYQFPWLLPAELRSWRAASPWPSKRCGSTGVPLAWMESSARRPRVPLRNPLWGSAHSLLQSLLCKHEHYMQRSESLSWEGSFNHPKPESLLQYFFGKMPADIKQ